MCTFTSKNFAFLKDTSLNHLYPHLEDNELICYRHPTNAKIYMDARAMVEELVKKIVEKSGYPVQNTLYKNLQLIQNNIPVSIYRHFEKIRQTGNTQVHNVTSERPVPPQDILKMLHECLVWYLQQWDKVMTIRVTFEYPPDQVPNLEMEKRIGEIEKQYKKMLEEYQKENAHLHRQYQATSTHLKEAKQKLELTNQKLQKTMVMAQKQSEKFKMQTDAYQQEQAQTVERFTQQLTGKDEEIGELQSRVQALEEQMKVADLNDREVSNEVFTRIEALNEAILEEEAVCSKVIEEVQQKMKTLEEVWLQKEEGVMHFAFYEGFTNLQGEHLRRVYAMLTKLNLANLTKVCVTTQLNKLTKSSVDQVEVLLQKEMRNISLLSDEDIKLKLYYRLLKLCRIEKGTVDNLEDFKMNLDAIVEKGYQIISKEKDFMPAENKLASISTYYLKKALMNFEAQYKSASQEEQQALTKKVYNSFENLPEYEKRELYEKLGIKNHSEQSVKSAILSLGPSVILTALVEIGGFASYTTLSSIIYAISSMIGTTFSFGVYTGAASFLSFLTGPFMLVLILGQGLFLYKTADKQQQSLVPLIIFQIITNKVCYDAIPQTTAYYEKLVEEWRVHKASYITQVQLKKEIEIKMQELQEYKGKVAFEKQTQIELKHTLQMKKEQITEELFRVITTSPHQLTLAEYRCYTGLLEEKRQNKQKKANGYTKGFFKQILNTSLTSINGVGLEMKIKACKLRVVEEARRASLFTREAQSLNNLCSQIEKGESIIQDLEAEINACQNEITQKQSQLNDLDRVLRSYLKEYPDFRNLPQDEMKYKGDEYGTKIF